MANINDYQVLQSQNIALGQYELPRPCYYILLFLGLWKPKNLHNIFVQFWFYFTSMIWFTSLCNIYVIMIISISSKNHVGAIINNFTSSLNLSLPFLYSRWFFNKNCYNDVLAKIISTDSSIHKKLKLLSKIYTLLAICVGLIFYTFFFFHWSSYIGDDEKYLPLFLVSLAFQVGYWSSWLSVYGFQCHALKLKINEYNVSVKTSMGISSRSQEEEQKLVSNLLNQFHEIRRLMEQTQSAFSLVISLGMIHHIANIVLLSIGFFKDEFGVHFSVYLFVLGIFCDVASILPKLWPAALVCQALHDVVITAGEHCNVDFEEVKLPKERFYFYKYLSMYEQDLGIYVLGVKITSQLTVGIFATMLTAGLTLIYYAMPYIKKIPEL